MARDRGEFLKWGDIFDALMEYHADQVMSKFLEEKDVRLARSVAEGALYAVEDVTAIDAVPVVRCKDCKYCSPYLEECGATTLYCRKHYSIAELVIPYDFCAYGERKDGGA